MSQPYETAGAIDAGSSGLERHVPFPPVSKAIVKSLLLISFYPFQF